MPDTIPAPWLESDEEFEGVGAHRLNPRYDPVDEEEPQAPVPHAQRLTLMAPRTQKLLTAVGSYRLDGHDGSHHQYDAGPVDLGVLSNATWIIWWKATQSTAYVDPTFLKTWARRRLFALAFAYHWLSSTTDPQQQAAHYLQIIGTLGLGDGCMLDAEEGGITVAECLAWCEWVEAITRRPVSVYTGLYVAGGTIWKSDALRMSKYGPRPFHVAAYVTEENLRARMISTGSQNYPWQAWQFSSNGPVPGITGRADMNRVDDREKYNTACAIKVQPQPQPGDDEEMNIIRNEEGRDGEAPGIIKMAVMPDGTWRHLTETELKARGITNSLDLGQPMSNAELDSMGEYKAPSGGGSAPTTVTSTVTSTIA